MTYSDPVANMKAAQAARKRGRLKVFLGMAAGVGKTFAMLSEAHVLRERGEDVAVGYVEPHGRVETESLLEGLPAIPPSVTEYRGVQLREFDVAAALQRAPTYLLVDELAHTNAEGSRHAKRWQDIEDCLLAGINVLTTVNIQHIESLRDVVAQITHIVVQETVPDSFIESADEIELVDIPPEQLHQRLRDGKVYIPEKVDQALNGFFKRSNLLALREIALRHTAQQVDRAILDERSQSATAEPWHVTERLLVCLAPNRMAPRVLRASKRLAASLHAEMIVVTVDSTRQASIDQAGREQLEYATAMAEQFGARTASLSSHDIVSEIIRFARAENVTTIVMGKPVRPRWRELLFGSVVDATVRASGDMDVLIITGTEESGTNIIRRHNSAPVRWRGIFEAVAIPAAFTLVGAAIYSPVHVTNITMLFVAASVLVSLRHGLRESLVASLTSMLLLNFFFIEPRFTFAISDLRYGITFVVMASVSLLLSLLTLRLRESSETLAERERRTSRLYEITRALAASRKKQEMADIVAQHIETTFGFPVAIWAERQTELVLLHGSVTHFEQGEKEFAVAEWVFQRKEPAGAGTDTLSGAEGFYVPLLGSDMEVGVLGLQVGRTTLNTNQRRYLESVCSQLAMALERTNFAAQAHEKALQAEAEELRSNLLSAVSHDLRTPLASIEGSASALLENRQLDGPAGELATNILQQSQRMNRQIRNLLDMTRVQGSIQLSLEWESLEDLVQNAIERTAPLLTKSVHMIGPEEPVMVKVDGVLLEQVLVNLLENAARHAGNAPQVTVEFGKSENRAWAAVSDNGPGVPPQNLKSIFEPFQRTGTAGFGLGLAICKAAVEAHGGEISALPTESGAKIRFEIPLEP